MRALAILVALLLARPADACKWEYVSMFRRFEDAGAVVHARVRAPGGKFALAVVTTLKGKTPKQIKLGFGRDHTSCTPHMRGTGIAFLTDDLKLQGSADSFTTDKEQVAALLAYAAAKTDAERAAVLVETALATDNTYVRYAAEVALADDPKALAAVTPADRDRMIAAIEQVRPSSFMPIVLARLGIAADKLKGTAAELAAERKFEAVKDPAALADIIEMQPKGPSARGVAAFERCERIRGKRLANFRNIVDDGIEGSGLTWQSLADLCRRG